MSLNRGASGNNPQGRWVARWAWHLPRFWAIAPDMWASRRMHRPGPRPPAQWKESRFHDPLSFRHARHTRGGCSARNFRVASPSLWLSPRFVRCVRMRWPKARKNRAYLTGRPLLSPILYAVIAASKSNEQKCVLTHGRRRSLGHGEFRWWHSSDADRPRGRMRAREQGKPISSLSMRLYGRPSSDLIPATCLPCLPTCHMQASRWSEGNTMPTAFLSFRENTQREALPPAAAGLNRM